MAKLFTDKEKREAKARQYAQKTPEWLAKRLALIDQQACDNERRANNESRKRYNLQCQLQRVLEENQNLAKVLRINGIRPRNLIVDYITKDCESCEHFYCDEEANNQCMAEDNYYEEKCIWKQVTESFAFYTFAIDDDELTGINSFFEYEELEVARVVDRETGRVLYERKEEDNDE